MPTGVRFPFRQKLKSSKVCDIFAVCLIAFTVIWLGLYCKFGTAVAIDEAFYLTIPERILAGDGLMTDEWQVSQLSSVLLLPLVWAWKLFHDSAEGMYLTFCGLYAVGQGLFLGGVYALLRKYRYAALLAVAVISQYSLMNFTALSYNSLGLYFAVLLMCLLVRLTEKASVVFTVLSGAIYAGLILCNPYTVFLFPFYVVTAAFFILREKRKRKPKPVPYFPVSLKGFLLFVAGILPVFIYFLAILLKNSSVGEIIACVPKILSDPEHTVTEDGGGVETFSLGNFFSGITDNIGVAAFVLCIILCLASVLLVRAKLSPLANVTVVAAVVIPFAGGLFHYFSDKYETDDPGILFFSFFAAGFALYYMNGRRNKAVFYSFIVGGFVYALLMEAASNLGYHAQLNGYVAALPGTVILLKEYFTEAVSDKNEKQYVPVAKACLSVTLAMLLFVPALYTFGLHESVFYASSPDLVTCRYGFYKGKYMTKEQNSRYALLWNDVQKLDELAEEGDRLLVINNLPVTYLETQKMEIGAFSAWIYTEHLLSYRSGAERFFSYYELFPDNTPDWIYIGAFGEYEDGTWLVHPEEFLQLYVTPYFEGEKVSLPTGLAFRVTSIKEINKNTQ